MQASPEGAEWVPGEDSEGTAWKGAPAFPRLTEQHGEMEASGVRPTPSATESEPE